MEITEYVGKRIRELRTSFGGKGISQEELSERLNVAANTLSRWETATYKPKLKDLDALAAFFGVSISEFFPKPEINESISGLMRAAQGLDKRDLETIRQLIDIKRAERLLKQKK